MAFCPANCSDNTLISNDPGNCDLQPRKRNIDRFGLFLCTTDLPSPFNCAALQALYSAGELVFTNPLSNIEVADPVKEELAIADCLPPLQIVTARTINFQDRIAIVKSNTSPWTGGTKNFYDYDFWADKKTKNFRLRYLIVYCDGTVVVAKDETGNLMTANLDIFLSQERQGSGGNSYILEIKKGILTFKGDPIDFTNKPEEDGAGNVFDIRDCNLF
jgi:hypothetical protein